MPVPDEEKRMMKEDFYRDEESFRLAFLKCIKYDDVQRGLFAAVVKGAIWWIFGTIAITILIVISTQYFQGSATEQTPPQIQEQSDK